MNPIRLAVYGVASLGASGAIAQTELFFSEYAFQNARMSAVRLDGSSPRVLFNLPSADWLPLGMSYDPVAARLFWMDSAGASEIKTASTNGANYATITPVTGFARGLSRDAAGRLYFSSGNQVRRVNADGTGLVPIFTAIDANPIGGPRVDATNAHVYIGADGEIKRMDLDGSNVKTVVRGVDQPRSIGLNIAQGFVYWIDTDTTSDFIGRARLDDTEFTVLIDNSPGTVGSSGMIDLLVDPASGRLFFAQEFPTATIRSADLNGGNIALTYTSPTAPSGMTLSTGEPVQPVRDCNGNSVPDDLDIAGGAPDCDNNGVIDSCQVNPCPVRVFLLDQGSNAASTTGRALGGTNQFQVFQPFDVPAAGWSIGEVAIDGFNINYAGPNPITVRLFRDNGSNLPDESQSLGSATLGLRFSIHTVAWVYAPLTATLAQGRYWVRIEANQPMAYSGNVNLGFSGLPSRSRGITGVFTNPTSPIALRIVEAARCVADVDDGTGSGTPDGGVTIDDLLYYLAIFDAGSIDADVDDGSGTGTQDGGVTIDDLLYYLLRFDTGC